MAIYHCSVKVISRSQGRSSVGASAYRSGERLYNERDGQAHDYRNKQGIAHTEILTPAKSPEWAKDRENLWNAVEKAEIRKDSQLAREVEVSLPNELNREQQLDLVRDYAKENFVDKGMIADISIHDKADGNPHAHIMLTMRPLDQDKFGKKERSWNSKDQLEKWRENWAEKANQHLEKAGYYEKIDHRSYENQGIEKTPTVHEGHVVRAMEQRGIETDIGNKNREIKQDNRMMELMDKQINSLEKQKELIGYDRGTDQDHGDRNEDYRIRNGIDESQGHREQSLEAFGRIEPHIKGGAGEQYLEGVLSDISREIHDIEKRAGQDPKLDNSSPERPKEQDKPDRDKQQRINQRPRERDRGLER